MLFEGKIEMSHIPWSRSIWFFDVDDTLINTADLTEVASHGIVSVIAKEVGEETAEKIRKTFVDIFHLLLQGHRIKKEEDWLLIPEIKKFHDILVKNIDAHQTEVILQQGKPKRWSREIFIKLAADEHNVTLSSPTISLAADGYWSKLTEEAVIYDGVLPLFEEIKKHDRPIFLVTGSDAHLQMNEQGQFSYDPSMSEEYKLRRIYPLREKGIHFHAVKIGDPVDKPHHDFFFQAIQIAETHLGQSIDTKNAIMIDDSAANLVSPKDELGFGLVVLVEKNKKDTLEVIDDRHVTTGNLSLLAQFLK